MSHAPSSGREPSSLPAPQPDAGIAIVVAPFDPESPAENLGAAQKITLVVRLLGRMGFTVHLVDSSHTLRRWQASTRGRPILIGDTEARLWRPAMVRYRALGKLLNFALPGALPEQLAALRPSLVWLYNSYAFEGRLGLALARCTTARLLLELEDLPTARRRGLSPKPWLDAVYFQRLLHRCDVITYVNAPLMRLYPPTQGRGLLFPSIIGADLASASPRTRFDAPPYRVGYFGGLEPEKGADVLLQAAGHMPEGWQLVVTGAGSLGPKFEAHARRAGARIEFHGQVPRERLTELMCGCDVIVNPHAPIASMGQGVFPFKVCEALVTGALLVTTALPSIDESIESAVVTFDGTAIGLVEALTGAPAGYRERRLAIARTRESLLAQYSERALEQRLRAMLLAPEARAS
jgi:glycosyltransferase involved in cell wall biosynthesis